ncbi:MAG: helix-turn-helix transcriptional regulator [Desulfuromonadaceae bacterium]|nr:helix-turn-helix transcriptional regulator [Desulfuromonadaceae bacterium]MDD2856473.1 helix-turn-helix transcriptional regulator [Desulfuromonadaceae bacterium]
MSDSLGRKITLARKRKGITQGQLGSAVGLTGSALSVLENDGLKSPPDAVTLIRISEALGAPEILMHHCETCPIRQHIMIKQFPDLNNIRTEPSIIANRLRQEMIEGAAAADELSQLYAHKDFQKLPEFQERHKMLHEQIVDAERAMEILKFELIRLGALTREDHIQIIENQQAKCIAHGHHVVEPGADGLYVAADKEDAQ